MLISQQKLIKRILRYSFFGALVLWTLIGIYIGYQYVRFSANKVITKGGTFVEGIFETTSFLPYLQNDTSSLFYQGLLFNSCAKNSLTGDDEKLDEDLCKIWTTDNQNFEIVLKKGMIRSDGTPISIEDVFFTYDEILRKNKRKLKGLDAYQGLKISKEGNKVKITFPTASIDNKIFFTNYILPKHSLETASLQDYIGTFAMEPIYTNCANIVSQSTDQYSLIFNLINCKDTHLNFYQIKNIKSFQDFENDINNGKGSIVDAYLNQSPLKGYVSKKLLTNKLVTLFFNTNSLKLRIRVRRALGGYIKSHFYNSGFDNYITRYDDPLFNQFLTDGTNVKDFLQRGYGIDSITKADLTDIGVKELPKTLTVNGDQPKYVFYTETLTGTDTIEITLDKEYDSAFIEYNGKTYSDATYSKQNKKINYPIGTKLNNFGSGSNKYKMYGYYQGKKLFIGSIDVYNLTASAQMNAADIPIEKMKVIYYNNPTYELVANNLQAMLTQDNLVQYFDFQKVNSAEELEGKIAIGDYDIIINSIDLGLKKDITNLFTTDNIKINPSQYKNPNLGGLLKEYINAKNESSKSKIATQINEIYAKDMPLMFLGKIFTPINIKESMVEKIFGSGNQNMELYESDRRNILYSSLHLVNNINIDQQKIRDYANFSNFLNQTFYPNKLKAPAQEASNSTGTNNEQQ